MKHDLDIEEDVPFQERAWRVERVGWTVMALVIAAALAGVLGPGPFSKTELSDRSVKMKAEFNRFERYQSPVILKVRIDPAVVSGEEVPLTLNRGFVDEVEMKHIDPEPERIETSGAHLNYYFAASSNSPAHITFHYEPNRFGKMPVELSAGQNIKLSFEQFYFP